MATMQAKCKDEKEVNVSIRHPNVRRVNGETLHYFGRAMNEGRSSDIQEIQLQTRLQHLERAQLRV